MSDLKIKDFKVSSKWYNKLAKIITPFSIQFWITIFLYINYRLINNYIISNTYVNLIYLIICLIILFY